MATRKITIERTNKEDGAKTTEHYYPVMYSPEANALVYAISASGKTEFNRVPIEKLNEGI